MSESSRPTPTSAPPASATTPFWRRPLVHAPVGRRSDATAQTPGMRRYAAISGGLTGSHGLWMGGNRVPPGVSSGDHHHGPAESGIYVVSGHPRLTFLVDDQERSIDAAPGDFIFVPAWVPHREENPSPDEEAIVVLARSTPEEIVVNLPDLRSTEGIPTDSSEPPHPSRSTASPADDHDGIRRTIALQAQQRDEGRLEEWPLNFTEDATIDALGRVCHGRDEISEHLNAVWRDGGGAGSGKHLLGPSVIDLDGDAATASTDFSYVSAQPDGGFQVVGVGRYHDRLVRSGDGRWRFARRDVRLLGATRVPGRS